MKKLRVGDEVIVNTGDDKGKIGKVIKVISEKNRIVVEGVNISKLHKKKDREGNGGGIVEKEAPFAISKVSLSSGGSPVRVGFSGSGKEKQRVNKKTGSKVG